MSELFEVMPWWAWVIGGVLWLIAMVGALDWEVKNMK